MKAITKDDKIIVSLNKKEIIQMPFNDEAKLEDYFKKIFVKLNNMYEIDMNGYYNVDIYLDDNYGAILEIKNEDLDYYNYFSQIDMKLNISKKTPFLYEIKYEFLDNIISKGLICYKNSDKLYLKVNSEIDEIILLKLTEYSNVIYGKEVENILKCGKKVRI